MMKRKKVLGSILLSAVLISGLSMTVLANSGSTDVGGTKISYSSSVTSSTGTALTTSNGGSAQVSVSSSYYYHDNVTYENSLKTDSKSGSRTAVVSFSCGNGYSTSYITSTHDATVGSISMNQQRTSASNS